MMGTVGGCDKEGNMAELVARTGRHQQRYEDGCRLVAGAVLCADGGLLYYFRETWKCIPFRYRGPTEDDGVSTEKIVEVLMINSTSGPGLLFPKGGWENDETDREAAVREAIEEAGVKGDLLDLLGYYQFKSKTLQDEFSPEGLCRAAMFALHVKEELQCWPEQSTRRRSWLTIPEALNCCRHAWMREAIEQGFLEWHATRTDIASRNNEGEEVECEPEQLSTTLP